MTAIRKGDLVESIAGALQYISFYHPADFISHLGDIAIRTGRKITWDPVQEQIVGDEQASRMMSRPMREPWTL